MSRLKKGGACAAACVAAVTAFEGVRQAAYQDVVGVWTVCAGETQGVKRGDRYTLGQCKDMLLRRLEDYAEPIEKCLPGMPDARFIAFTSLAYNIGANRACKSSAAAHVRLGMASNNRILIAQGCDLFMAWNKAKGIVFPGLTKRRVVERDMCLKASL